MDSASLDPLSDGDLTWLRTSGTRGRKSHGSRMAVTNIEWFFGQNKERD